MTSPTCSFNPIVRLRPALGPASATSPPHLPGKRCGCAAAWPPPASRARCSASCSCASRSTRFRQSSFPRRATSCPSPLSFHASPSWTCMARSRCPLNRSHRARSRPSSCRCARSAQDSRQHSLTAQRHSTALTQSRLTEQRYSAALMRIPLQGSPSDHPPSDHPPSDLPPSDLPLRRSISSFASAARRPSCHFSSRTRRARRQRLRPILSFRGSTRMFASTIA